MKTKCKLRDFLCENRAHLLLLLVGVAIHIAGCFQNSLWFDEAYTVGLMNHNLFDMIKWAASDVHPHLYYILLWFVTRILGTDLAVMRLFSALGTILFASVGITHISRDFGKKHGFWFSFCAFFSGSMLVYTNQIRMYTWAAYFVTLAAIYAYRVFQSSDDTKNRVLFLVTSVCAAYTHYFALFTVAAVNITLLYGYNKKKIEKPLEKWMKTAVAQVVCYIPGAIVFLYQMFLGGATWITLSWPDIVFDLVSYHWTGAPLGDIFEYNGAAYLVFGGMFLLLFVIEGLLVYRFVKSDSTETKVKHGVCGALISYFGVLLFAFSVSLFRPIYYIRYTAVLSGLLFFFVSFFMSSLHKKVIKMLFVGIFVILFSVSAVVNFDLFYDKSSNQLDEAIMDEIEETDTFLFENINGYVASVSYPENTTYFYNKEKWRIHNPYRAFGPEAYVIDSLDSDEINGLSGRVWVVDRNDCYNKLKSLGYTDVKSHHINMRYHSVSFELILMQKP